MSFIFSLFWSFVLDSFGFPLSGIKSLLFSTQEMIVASEAGKSVVSIFMGGFELMC